MKERKLKRVGRQIIHEFFYKYTCQPFYRDTQGQFYCRPRETDQIVLGTVRQEVGPQERRTKAIKAKLSPGGPSGEIVLMMVRRKAGPHERWPKTLEGKL